MLIKIFSAESDREIHGRLSLHPSSSLLAYCLSLPGKEPEVGWMCVFSNLLFQFQVLLGRLFMVEIPPAIKVVYRAGLGRRMHRKRACWWDGNKERKRKKNTVGAIQPLLGGQTEVHLLSRKRAWKPEQKCHNFGWNIEKFFFFTLCWMEKLKYWKLQHLIRSDENWLIDWF